MGSHRLTVVVLGAAVLLAGCSTAPESAPEPTPAEGPQTTFDELGTESITVQPFADFVISSGDLAWVSGVAPGIVAFDDTMTPAREVPADEVWAALEFGHGFVWASESTNGLEATTLVRIDPGTGDTVRFAVPAPGIPPESSIGITDDAVWALVGPTPEDTFSVVGLDLVTGALLRTFELEVTPAAVRGGFGSLWITSATGELLRLDPLTGGIQASIELERSLTFLAVGPDAIWVINQLGNLFRVDPSTDSLVATVPVTSNGIIGGDIVATLMPSGFRRTVIPASRSTPTRTKSSTRSARAWAAEASP